MFLDLKLRSSLVKILPNAKTPSGVDYNNASALKGELVHFQVVWKANFQYGKIYIRADSPLKQSIVLRTVELVPVDYFPPEMDTDAVGVKIGLYPDLLREIPRNVLSTVCGQWCSVWVSVTIPENCTAGKYPVKLFFDCFDIVEKCSAMFASPVFTLTVLDAVLPEQTLKNTNWLHVDAIASFYHVRVFSEKHWRLIQKFVKSAVSLGVNMLYTPLFTPPLDTEVGSERITAQLIGIRYRNEEYQFDFSRLDRWVDMGLACGIRYFEMSHFFTQWGARFTPKILAEVSGKTMQIGGWDVPATSLQYEAFLAAFLPQLRAFWLKRRLYDRVYFHCSDEPHIEDIHSYGLASALMYKYLPDGQHCDALSRIEVFRNSHCQIPIVCERALEDFKAEDLPEKWTYYCCEPFRNYPNRFIYMNSVRNRILGTLLYRYQIDGFLHWGFNFYFSRLARARSNPYRDTTAGRAFPAGDAFLVYPGVGGKIEHSIRGIVFHEALQDQRKLQLLGTCIGREKVENLLDAFGGKKHLSMTDFPTTEKRFIEMQRIINKTLAESILT
jgi:hypothetical protein